MRTALITGASSGIGRALAHTLAAAGLEVALSGRREAALREVAAEIAAAGGRARVDPFDVTEPAATEAAVRRIDDEMGGLDLVIANAGMGTMESPATMSWSTCGPTIQVNVVGAVATLVAVLPRMLERKRGHLVGLSSLAQYRALPRNATYSASKAFLSTFLEGLRIDLRGTGVNVTDVRPGFVRTPGTATVDFDMPFLMESEQAAAIIWKGIVKRRAVVAFPSLLAWAASLGRLLPAPLYEACVRGMQKQPDGRSGARRE